jgi:hypothetical protein
VIEFKATRRKQDMNVRHPADATDQVKKDVQSPASKIELACEGVQLINEYVDRLQRCKAEDEFAGRSRQLQLVLQVGFGSHLR